MLFAQSKGELSLIANNDFHYFYEVSDIFSVVQKPLLFYVRRIELNTLGLHLRLMDRNSMTVTSLKSCSS